MTDNKKKPVKKVAKPAAAKKAVAKKPAAKKTTKKSVAPKKPASLVDEDVIATLDKMFGDKAISDSIIHKVEKVQEDFAPMVNEVSATIEENIAHVQEQIKKISKWRKFFMFGKNS